MVGEGRFGGDSVVLKIGWVSGSSSSMALMVSSVCRCNFARANDRFREYAKRLAKGSKLGSNPEMTGNKHYML